MCDCSSTCHSSSRTQASFQAKLKACGRNALTVVSNTVDCVIAIVSQALVLHSSNTVLTASPVIVDPVGWLWLSESINGDVEHSSVVEMICGTAARTQAKPWVFHRYSSGLDLGRRYLSIDSLLLGSKAATSRQTASKYAAFNGWLSHAIISRTSW